MEGTQVQSIIIVFLKKLCSSSTKPAEMIITSKNITICVKQSFVN